MAESTGTSGQTEIQRQAAIKQQEDEARAAGARVGNAVTGAVATGAAAVQGGATVVADAAKGLTDKGPGGVAADAQARGQAAAKNFDPWSLVGGLITGVLGWMLGSWFGNAMGGDLPLIGGLAGPLVGLGVGASLFVGGGNQIGNWLKGMFGRFVGGDDAARGTQGPAPSQAAGKGEAPASGHQVTQAKVAMLAVPAAPNVVAADTPSPVFDSKALDELLKVAKDQGIIKDEASATVMFVPRRDGVTIPSITSMPQENETVARLQVPVEKVRQMLEGCKSPGGGPEAAFDLWKADAQGAVSCVRTPHPRLDVKPIVR